jgi:hypothetical protein
MKTDELAFKEPVAVTDEPVTVAAVMLPDPVMVGLALKTTFPVPVVGDTAIVAVVVPVMLIPVPAERLEVIEVHCAVAPAPLVCRN